MVSIHVRTALGYVVLTQRSSLPARLAAETMASGFGLHGGKGRCFDLWMDFSDCMSRCQWPSECSLLREDYFECLHHRKEYTRINAINKERERQAAAEKAAKAEGKTKEEEH